MEILGEGWGELLATMVFCSLSEISMAGKKQKHKTKYHVWFIAPISLGTTLTSPALPRNEFYWIPAGPANCYFTFKKLFPLQCRFDWIWSDFKQLRWQLFNSRWGTLPLVGSSSVFYCKWRPKLVNSRANAKNVFISFTQEELFPQDGETWDTLLSKDAVCDDGK